MANCWKCDAELTGARCGECATWNRCGELVLNGVLRATDEVTIYVAEESGPGNLVIHLASQGVLSQLPRPNRKRAIKSKAFVGLWSKAIGDHPLLAEATPRAYNIVEEGEDKLLFVEVHGLPSQPAPAKASTNGVHKGDSAQAPEELTPEPQPAQEQPAAAAPDDNPATMEIDAPELAGLELAVLPATPPSASAQRLEAVREAVHAATDAKDLHGAVSVIQAELERPSAGRRLAENLYLQATLADLLEREGDAQGALRAYASAFALDPRNEGVLSGYAEALAKSDDVDLRLHVNHNLLLHHRRTLEAEQLAAVYRRIGMAHYAAQDWDRARSAFEQALDHRADDAEAMSGLLETVKSQGDPELVIQVRQRVMDHMTDPKGRAMVRVAIGDDYRKRLGDVERAIEEYEASVAEHPNAPAMTRLAKFALDAEDWKRALRAFKAMAETLDDPAERARAWAQAASLYEHHLSDPDKAIEAYDKALDLAPTVLEPFSQLVQLLAGAERYRELRSAYERMIARVLDSDSPSGELLAALWSRLGEVQRLHLADSLGATRAYENALEITPSDRSLRGVLASLYAAGDDDPEALQKAIDHNRALLVSEGNIDPVVLERIGLLYMRIKEYDAAFCTFRALSYLGAADARAQVFVDKYQNQYFSAPEVLMDPEFFQDHLYSAGYDAAVAEVFGIARHALYKLFAHDLDSYGIHPKRGRVDNRDGLMFNNVYRTIAERLCYDEVPPVYEYDQVPSMVNGSLYPAGFLIGSAMMAGRGEKELAFVIAKQLAMFRDEAFLFGFRRLLDMQAIFVTLAKSTNPAINVNMTEDMERVKKAFDKLKPVERKERLQALMVSILQRKTSKVNLAALSRCLDMAANRCGLLFCDDLQVCEEMLAIEAHPDADSAERPSVRARMRDLVLWTVDPSYHALRRELGLAIGQA